LLVILADGGLRGRARRAGPRFHTPDPRVLLLGDCARMTGADE
jgi:hypothetical protein